jgi:hypothetical protein
MTEHTIGMLATQPSHPTKCPDAGEEDAPLDDDLAAANAAALRVRVRELEVENSLIQRELAHVGELAERQGQQLQCGLLSEPAQHLAMNLA